jgi:hypothetical protein
LTSDRQAAYDVWLLDVQVNIALTCLYEEWEYDGVQLQPFGLDTLRIGSVLYDRVVEQIEDALRLNHVPQEQISLVKTDLRRDPLLVQASVRPPCACWHAQVGAGVGLQQVDRVATSRTIMPPLAPRCTTG